MQEIKKWLDAKEKDYNLGIQLMQKHGQNYAWYHNVIRLIGTQWGKMKLENELRRLWDQYGSKMPQAEPEAPESGNQHGDKTTTEGNDEPDAGEQADIVNTGAMESEVDNFEYKVPLHQLPEELQAQVVEKGRLYDKAGMLKEVLLKVPQNNQPASVSTRKAIRDEMKAAYTRIKEIYAAIRAYEASLEQPPAGNTDNPDNPETGKPDAYEQMNDAELQVALTKLYSAKSKNDARAEDAAVKEATRENNRKLAAEKQAEIDKIIAIQNARKSA